MNSKCEMTVKRCIFVSAMALGLAATAQSAAATEAPQCEQVRLTDPGWTDISVTNALAGTVLTGLGYSPSVDLLAVPIGFESLKKGEIDVFLGNWMPAQQGFIDKYGPELDKVRTNLEGAKFTLAVPSYVYDSGVTRFEDLGSRGDDFRQRIYGIDPGAPANGLLQGMIDKGDFGLEGWKLIESGEQAMLSQVSRAVRKNESIVFLGWAPHPMNLRVDMRYLAGGDEYFGPNYGGASIHTVTRKGYSAECPNVGTLLGNMAFSLDMESAIMGAILDDGKKADLAASEWLTANPEVLADWLENVRTRDGQPGLAAVKNHLGL
ncbi:choline ABC transporter substrate-binding protein [Marinobacterium sedimentorum]|uniref:choline ABC transporter substrate-binding protein n=1 Tax=Marinobacterium sedimentorum TaxID=2927804 RepID=UPI0020C6DC9E|nr:choline ABC transporter substrate-binding protein [Marinobacterium sedimentorum]MCP8689357.1 choline ABC transporter substrate-binding protein [Marinobacterium sedimentorum]